MLLEGEIGVEVGGSELGGDGHGGAGTIKVILLYWFYLLYWF